MIARTWSGSTRVADADRYAEYVEETGVRQQRAVPGNLGSVVLRRLLGDRVEFIVLSLWESFDAIKAFAGERPETAVYYPDDKRYLLELKPTVDHYEVVAGSLDAEIVKAIEASG